MTSVAIMQPTLMPWLGYFALMDAVDKFVYLDDVQYVKRSWQSRNRIRGSDGELMLSLGIDKNTAKHPINEVRLAASHNHDKFMKSISRNLGKTPYFDLTFGIIENAYKHSSGYLCRLNTAIIDAIASTCGVNTQRVHSSSMGIEKCEKSVRLLNICQKCKAQTYLSPIGSIGYLKDLNPFNDATVALRFLHYEHPVYQQGKASFMPYLSCIDALSWLGPENFLTLIRSGVKEPLTIEQAQLYLEKQ